MTCTCDQRNVTRVLDPAGKTRSCFAEHGKEMYKDLKRKCTAIVLLVKPFVWRRSCCRWLRGLLKVANAFAAAESSFYLQSLYGEQLLLRSNNSRVWYRVVTRRSSESVLYVSCEPSIE